MHRNTSRIGETQLFIDTDAFYDEKVNDFEF